MANIVVDFLKDFAKKNNFSVFDSIYGEIDPTFMTQSSGAVYGIWVDSSITLSQPASPISKTINWYPVYWGKDITPVSRILAHARGYTKTGSLNIPSIAYLKNKKIIYGAILVERYDSFEKLLHQKHPPLSGTARTGRKPRFIKIIK